MYVLQKELMRYKVYMTEILRCSHDEMKLKEFAIKYLREFCENNQIDFESSFTEDTEENEFKIFDTHPIYLALRIFEVEEL